MDSRNNRANKGCKINQKNIRMGKSGENDYSPGRFMKEVS